MYKIILNNIIIIITTLALVLSYCFFAKDLQILVRKYILGDENANLTVENIDASLIDSSKTSSTIMFIYDEYTINDGDYICVVEYITNEGELKGFRISGRTEDSNYRKVADIENITMMVQENEAENNSNLYATLTEEQMYNLQVAYKNTSDLDNIEYEYSIITSEDAYIDNDTHGQNIFGFTYITGQISLVEFYSYVDNVLKVCKDEQLNFLLNSITSIIR